jgi:glycolate oxidase FAD binding subunit
VETIRATSEAEIADAVRDFGARGKSLEIVSGGSKRALGRFAPCDAILDVSALSGIVSYEPDELVITARAATPLTEIEAVLAAKRQMLAFSPVDWGPPLGAAEGRATLAGVVAADGSGSRAFKAGRVRDHLIGCHFVNGLGEAVTAGGKVVKNVTGFDIPKLMCGAFGTLGVLTELTFRVVPAPERAISLVVETQPEQGLRALRHASALPVEPTGLAYLPESESAVVRVEGDKTAAEAKLALLQQNFPAAEPHTLDNNGTTILFHALGEGAPLSRGSADLWRVVLPAAAAHEAVVASGAPRWSADWGGNLLWLALPGDTAAAHRLRGVTQRLGGHATLIRGSEQARAELDVFEPEPPARAALTRSVKAAFDPKWVLNPGRMYRDV